MLVPYFIIAGMVAIVLVEDVIAPSWPFANTIQRTRLTLFTITIALFFPVGLAIVYTTKHAEWLDTLIANLITDGKLTTRDLHAA